MGMEFVDDILTLKYLLSNKFENEDRKGKLIQHLFKTAETN